MDNPSCAPPYTKETHNETINKCSPKFIQTDSASLVQERPISCLFLVVRHGKLKLHRIEQMS